MELHCDIVPHAQHLQWFIVPCMLHHNDLLYHIVPHAQHLQLLIVPHCTWNYLELISSKYHTLTLALYCGVAHVGCYTVIVLVVVFVSVFVLVFVFVWWSHLDSSLVLRCCPRGMFLLKLLARREQRLAVLHPPQHLLHLEQHQHVHKYQYQHYHQYQHQQVKKAGLELASAFSILLRCYVLFNFIMIHWRENMINTIQRHSWQCVPITISNFRANSIIFHTDKCL